MKKSTTTCECVYCALLHIEQQTLNAECNIRINSEYRVARTGLAHFRFVHFIWNIKQILFDFLFSL